LPENDTRSKRSGNYKPGPGRPPGRKNNRTLELEHALRQAASNVSNAFAGDAHAFLASVYKNPDFPLEVRILAAGRALRVEKPVLSAVQGRMEVNFNVAERLGQARRRVAERDRAATNSNCETFDGRLLMVEQEGAGEGS